MKVRRQLCLATFSTFFSLLMAVTASGQTVALRGALDMQGDWDAEAFGVTVGYDSKIGLSLGVEVAVAATREYAAGFGIEYQLDREIDASTDPSAQFGFVPIYGFGKYSTGHRAPSVFLVGRLGYNILHKGNDTYESGADLSGGIFYAFGAGVDLGNGSQVELTYAVNEGKAEAAGTSMDIEYSRVSIAYSYAFRF